MTAHRWLFAAPLTPLLGAWSTEGSCGSLSSRDRRRQHLLVALAGAELRRVELLGGSTAGAPTLASYAPHAQYSPRARPTTAK